MATKKTPNSTVRQPDFDLAVLNKDNNQKGRIGAGWLNTDGSISIRLNPLVVLPADPELVVTLFKRSLSSVIRGKAAANDMGCACGE